MKIKNIIIIILTLIFGVVETWGQTEVTTSLTATTVLQDNTIYKVENNQTITNSTISVAEGATATIYIPKGVTLTISGVDGKDAGGWMGFLFKGAEGAPGYPAIRVPENTTLIITGEGALKVSGGKGSQGRNAGSGGHGGGGSAPAIGGAGGYGGKGKVDTEAKFPSQGEKMGNVYIIGSVKVDAKKGAAGGTENGLLDGGRGGAAALYDIGGGGGGGNSRDGYKDNETATAAPGDDGHLYIQNPDNITGLYNNETTEKNISLNGKTALDILKASIQFKDGVNVLESRVVYYGVTMNDAPSVNRTMEGYTFNGYKYNDKTYFDKDNKPTPTAASLFLQDAADPPITLEADWKIIKYHITYDANGGQFKDGKATKEVDEEYFSTYSYPIPEDRENFTFMGWFTSIDDNRKEIRSTDIVNSSAEEHLTLYAIWSSNTYLVAWFDPNGGVGEMPQQVIRGRDNLYPCIFTKTTTDESGNTVYWRFTGWKDKDNKKEYKDRELITVDDLILYKEIILTAQWEEYSADTYIISTPAELMEFARKVNEDGMEYINGILSNDIDMKDSIWIPIGSDKTQEVSRSFKGTFDGNGYVISNLKMAKPDGNDDDEKWNNGYSRVGLIGCAEGATIKNVVVHNATLYGKWQIAAICGRISNRTENGQTVIGKIQNCGSYGELNFNHLSIDELSYIDQKALNARSAAGVAISQSDDCTISSVWSTYDQYDNTKYRDGGLDDAWQIVRSIHKNHVIASWNDTNNSNYNTYTQNAKNYNSKNKRTWVYVKSTITTTITNGELTFNLNKDLGTNMTWTQTFGKTVGECPRPTSRYKEVFHDENGYYNKYSVFYISNGGTPCDGFDNRNIKRYSTGDPINTRITLPKTTRIGYDFQGWWLTQTDETDAAKQIVEGISDYQVIEDDMILFAHWKAQEPTIAFNENHKGGTTSRIKQEFDAKYILPTNPERTGYVFLGWFTESDNNSGDKIESGDIVKVPKEQDDEREVQKTLYAHWEAIIYRVSFDSNGGSAIESINVTYDDIKENLPVPTFEGYKFEGWYTEREGGSKKETIEKTLNDMTLYAHWTRIKYTIRFDNNDKSGNFTEIEEEYGSNYRLPTQPSRTGYTFSGWWTDASTGDKITSDQTVDVTEDVTLYAHWTANTYQVSFDSNGGSAIAPIDVTYDGTYETLPDATRYGYNFDGWYTESGTKIEKTARVDITDNMTLYAHWSPKATNFEAYTASGLGGYYFRSFFDSKVAYEMPDKVMAFTAKVDNDYLLLTAIEGNIIPKNTPVILRAEESAIVQDGGKNYITLVTSESGKSISAENVLLGTDDDMDSHSDNCYILSHGSKGLGFYKWPTTKTLEAHKAYIEGGSSSAKALIFRFEDEATGINNEIIDSASDESEPVIYNLSGIRISKPQKGINIINGKKVWVPGDR